MQFTTMSQKVYALEANATGMNTAKNYRIYKNNEDIKPQ